ncbi:hypothetical protein BCV70DRAFT_230434 [Testicularia cyperi]|uniref:U6 snRNA phosphodiesterase 1 n=1 Tax=Testicularia cyperi TaxID=1882483 RepID=A0A317XYE2_9BASI|nr:hypothetical protein BCV70DRAFT_230434 [Testicularia cyperi]
MSPAKQSSKKRRLPALDDDFPDRAAVSSSSNDSVDDQACGRSAKKVRGEWLCYCFIEISLNDRLTRFIQRCHHALRSELGTDTPFAALTHGDGPDGTGLTRDNRPGTPNASHLHISLTRPITVHTHERDDFLAEVKSLLQNDAALRERFEIAFSHISHLQNDDKDRDFLVLEVGMGREKLRHLSDVISKGLHRAFRARPYYQEARFHASTGYVEAASTAQSVPGDKKATATANEEDMQSEPAKRAPNSSHSDDSAPLDLVAQKLEDRLGPELRSLPTIRADRIGVQVGKKVVFLDL